MSETDKRNDLKERVARVVTEELRPVLQMEGGDMELVDLAGGVVRVRLHGTCSGCPSVTMAVLMGLEQELRQRVPEIEYLEVVP
jgi:Fe-S cluster biogenesis protein NfuA